MNRVAFRSDRPSALSQFHRSTPTQLPIWARSKAAVRVQV
jgi:hypothetical protein